MGASTTTLASLHSTFYILTAIRKQMIQFDHDNAISQTGWTHQRVLLRSWLQWSASNYQTTKMYFWKRNKKYYFTSQILVLIWSCFFPPSKNGCFCQPTNQPTGRWFVFSQVHGKKPCNTFPKPLDWWKPAGVQRVLMEVTSTIPDDMNVALQI